MANSYYLPTSEGLAAYLSPSLRQARAKFFKHDLNMDGSLGMDDLNMHVAEKRKINREFDDAMIRAETEREIKMRDLDQNGSLSMSEWLTTNCRVACPSKVTFSQYDMNGDGKITPDEIRYRLLVNGYTDEAATAKVKEMMTTLDVNRDGHICYREMFRPRPIQRYVSPPAPPPIIVAKPAEPPAPTVLPTSVVVMPTVKPAVEPTTVVLTDYVPPVVPPSTILVTPTVQPTMLPADVVLRPAIQPADVVLRPAIQPAVQSGTVVLNNPVLAPPVRVPYLPSTAPTLPPISVPPPSVQVRYAPSSILQPTVAAVPAPVPTPYHQPMLGGRISPAPLQPMIGGYDGRLSPTPLQGQMPVQFAPRNQFGQYTMRY